MRYKHVHMALNILVILALIMSLTAEYLTFSSYKVTLWGINHELLYEDVSGTAYVSFEDFDSFACQKSRNEDILTICGGLRTFEISGWVLGISCILYGILSVYYCFINWKQRAEKIVRLVGPGIYVAGSMMYFLMISGSYEAGNKGLVIPSYESGCFWVFLINAMAFVTTGAFVLNYLKNAEDYEEFDMVKGLNTEEILMEKRVNSELQAENQCTNRSDNPNDTRKLEQENSELREKIRKISEDSWVQFNELKLRLEKTVRESWKEPKKAGPEALEKVLNELNELSLYSLGQKGWENERDDLLSTVRSLNNEIERSRKSKAKEEENLRNQVLNLEAERSMLIENIEKTNAELRILEKAKKSKDLDQANEEILRLTKESTTRMQEIEKFNKTIQEKQTKIKELEDLIKRHEASESKYVVQIEDLKRALKEEIPMAGNISEMDSEAFNEQLSFYTEALKRSKDERSQIEYKFQTLSSKNARLKTELEDINIKYQESSKQIEYLKKELTSMIDNKSLQEKAIESIGDMSSLIESLKEQDSKATEERSIITEKYNICKSAKKSAEKDLKTTKKKLAKLENDITEHEKLEKALTQQLEKLKNDINIHLKNHKAQEEEWDRVKGELVYSNTQQTREVEILQLRMRTQENFFENELQNNQLENGMLKDELKKYTELAEFYKVEYSRLKALEDRLNIETPAELEEYREMMNEQISKISESLLMYEEKISKLTAEKEKLRKKLQAAEKEIQSISEECQILHKKGFENKKESLISLGSIDDFSRSIQDSLIIEGISPSIIFHNPLIERVSKLRKEPPMTYATLWKTLEGMMVEKHKLDQNDIKMAREPRSAADYMFEFMYQKYGLKALGLKQLKALITSLEELYKLNHPYAIFYCRLLGVFHSRPLPIRVIVYLCSVQELFNSISKKVKETDENYAEIYEVQQFGGEASIVDVVEIVKKIYKSHRVVGERILERLYMDQPDKLEVTILKICGNLYREGKDDSYVFRALNAKKGVLDYHEFIDGLRTVLDVWISQEDAEALCSFIDEKETGLITFENWKKKVNFEEQVKKIYSKPAMVTKADFLNGIISEYEYQVVEDYYGLRKIIKGNMLTAEKASQYFVQLDSSLSLEAQERLFKEALAHEGGNGEEVSNEALCIIILKHSIGGHGRGIFQQEILQEALSR